MSEWRRWLGLVLALGAALAAYFLFPVSTDVRGADWVRVIAGIGALLLLVVLVLRQVQLQIQRPERRIDGLLVAMVIGVSGFALLFFTIAQHRPDEFVGIETRIDSLYFTMTTLLTVGYGDIHAEGQLARSLVIVSMVFNVVVIATAATTLSNQVRTRAIARAEQRQERRTQRNPR